MKDKTIEQLEDYLKCKGIQTHFEEDVSSWYEYGIPNYFQELSWDINIFIRAIYRVEMNSGLSTFYLMLAHANFSDCKLITDTIYEASKEWE